ncbi:MAG: TonB family protein [bacterium]|nr:TonB family protein [bacterium]
MRLFVIILVISPIWALAQNKVFYDMEDNKVINADRAFYYSTTKFAKVKPKKSVTTITENFVFNDQLKKVASHLTVDPSVMVGEYKEFYITGQVRTEGAYQRGNKQVGFKTYHYNGQLASEISSNDEGQLMITKLNHAGIVESSKPYFDDEIYSEVEEWPYFFGGKEELYKFLGLNVKYPYRAASKKIEGKVFVQFIVNHDGTLSDIEVIRGIGEGCDEEAIRVIELTDKMWVPGKHEEKIVKTRMVVPISFKLSR